MKLILHSRHYHGTEDHLEPLFAVIHRDPFSLFKKREKKNMCRLTVRSQFDSKYFLVLWFSSKKLSSDEEAWQTANFLCIVIAHE